MALDTTICCCGASKWTKVIASIQIVGNLLYLCGIWWDSRIGEDVRKTILAIPITTALLGIIMGVILFKGTIEKRFGYLIAWLIYGSVGLCILIVFNVDRGNIAHYGIIFVGIVLNIFVLVVISIHTKDIQPAPTSLASIWTTVIAWVQIVANSLYFIASVVGLVVLIELTSDITGRDMNGVIWVALALAIVFAFVGIVMGIILLKGTNQKRVGYLRAWLIYGGVTLAVAIVSIILNSIGATTHTLASTVVNGLKLIALNVFTIVVVYVHMKEINEGVFDVHPKQTVNM